MKKKIFLSVFIFVLSFTTLIISCNKDENQISSEVTKFTLKETTLLGNEINLPTGTKWFYTNKTHNEVEFELPDGYKFLQHNETTGEFKIVAGGGGYSCTCSSGGSCTTFYNKDLGYGCLQSTCGGSCTGANSKINYNLVIEGIVYTDNGMIDAKTFQKASLSEKGKKGIFTVPEFRKQIKKTYDLVYKNLSKPNFSDANFETKIDQNKYVVAKTYLYSFELGLIIPNDSNLKNIMPNLQTMKLADAPKSGICIGGTTGCKLEKDGLFGYVAYYCTGCTTCTMQ